MKKYYTGFQCGYQITRFITSCMDILGTHLSDTISLQNAFSNPFYVYIPQRTCFALYDITLKLNM